MNKENLFFINNLNRIIVTHQNLENTKRQAQ